MNISRILCIAVSTLVLGSGALFAQTAPRTEDGKEKKPRAERPERPERETAEMKEARAKEFQFRVEMLNLMAKNGKMEKAHADYLISRLRNEKAFKDANPEWVKYEFHPMPHFAPGAQGFGHGQMQGPRMAPGQRMMPPHMKPGHGQKKENAPKP